MCKNIIKRLTTIAIGALVLMTVCNPGHAQGVRGFDVPRGKLPLRGFGNPKGEEALMRQFPEAAAAIIGEDRLQASWQIARNDGNGDGIVTEAEWVKAGVQAAKNFVYQDLNGDGVLTLYEQSIGFASWRRRNERRSDARVSAARAARPKPAPPASTAALQAPIAVNPQAAARERQATELSEFLLRAYDTNENDIIERTEFKSQSSRYGNLGSADLNGDGEVRRKELEKWLRNRQAPLPPVQLSLEMRSFDANGDSQVSFREYTTGSDTSSLTEFQRWDRNRDGFIEATESQEQPPVAGRDYSNDEPQVIGPNAAVVSQIWVKDDDVIEDLDINVVISKEGDAYTELYLVAPDRRRVNLFDGNGWVPWGGGLILKGIRFDDEAPVIKKALRQPPPVRTLQPPGVGVASQASLADFKGTTMRGVWRLVVRNQNERAGLLVSWSLKVTPAMEALR